MIHYVPQILAWILLNETRNIGPLRFLSKKLGRKDGKGLDLNLYAKIYFVMSLISCRELLKKCSKLY